MSDAASLKSRSRKARGSFRPSPRDHTRLAILRGPPLPTCSVIVCTRFRSRLLQRCIGSLQRLERSADELIIVDNTDGDQGVIEAAKGADARYLCEPVGGLSRARNAGVAAAGGEIVSFIDDDAVADWAWLSRQASAFRDPRVMAATGRVLPSGPLARSGHARLMDLGEAAFTIDRRSSDWFERANFGGIGFGANMAVRRTVFEGGTWFDERLGAGSTIGAAEECHLLFRIIRNGGRVEYVPSAVVRHDGPTARDHPRVVAFKGTRSYSAYLLMLLAEEREFRAETRHHIFDAARGAPKPWRRVGRSDRDLPRAAAWAAAIAGLPLYVRSRFRASVD